MPEARFVQIGEIAAGTRPILVHGAFVVIAEKRAGHGLKRFHPILRHHHMLLRECPRRYAELPRESSDVLIIDHDLQRLAAIRTGRTVDLRPDIVGDLLNDRVQFIVGKIDPDLKPSAEIPVLIFVVLRTTLDQRKFTDDLIVGHQVLPVRIPPSVGNLCIVPNCRPNAELAGEASSPQNIPTNQSVPIAGGVASERDGDDERCDRPQFEPR